MTTLQETLDQYDIMTPTLARVMVIDTYHGPIAYGLDLDTGKYRRMTKEAFDALNRLTGAMMSYRTDIN